MSAPPINPPGQYGPYYPQVFYVQPPAQPVRSTSGLAVAAMVTGIAGLVFGWCFFALPCLAAVILGHLALSDTAPQTGRNGRGMAVAGLVLGYVGVVPAALIFIFYVVGSL